MRSRTRLLSHLPIDEELNVLTSGLGFLLSLIGIPVLLLRYSYVDSNPKTLLGVGAFSLGLLMVYYSSTSYHYFTGQLKAKWRVFDHISIFFLIGGTYTAYILKYLGDSSTGINFLLVHWSIIAFGVIFKLFFTGRFEAFSVFLYLVLGWMVLYIITPARAVLPDDVGHWLIAGGLSYSIGVGFYLAERYKYAHPIWHLFVLGGSTFHFIGLCY